jgi:glycosyltransferase involved in cell wall biosynthesis
VVRAGTRAVTRVVVLRGRAANPWDLRPWASLGEGYDVAVLVPANNEHDVSGLPVEKVPVRALSGRLPGPLVRVPGERYLDLEPRLRGADIVHAAELGYWFSMQAARLKPQLHFKLALTVWETLPFLDAYRNVRTRRYRRAVLDATDLFLATTERAREALLLEGAADSKIEVCAPGVDLSAFAVARPEPAGPPVVLTACRLVWEKGVQDLLRALARLARPDVRAVIVGEGPDRKRLEAHARELGVAAEFRGAVPYAEMPSVFAGASCFFLGSLPVWSWEEQFGMVLAEAMAAHVPVVAAASGAIPEVLGGAGRLFNPGDWVGLADVLGSVLDGSRRVDPGPVADRYTAEAAAGRLRAAYARLA